MDTKELRFDFSKNKYVEYLFISPFANGGKFAAQHIPEKCRLLPCSREKTSLVLEKIFNNNIRIDNILLANSGEINNNIKKYIKENKINLSYYEKGFFPHIGRWFFDSHGFCGNSLLAHSRIDHLNIDEDLSAKMINQYIQKYVYKDKDFKLQKHFIVVIMQHPSDGTVCLGYKNFHGWQEIIDWVSSEVRKKGELLILKMHPSNVVTREKIILPENSIAIQTKIFNDYLLKYSNLIIGINSSLLFEASMIYNKPTVALGESWFTCHPEIAPIVKIGDKFRRPFITPEIIKYRRKMFYLLDKMQTKKEFDYKKFFDLHYKASKITKIEEWIDQNGK